MKLIKTVELPKLLVFMIRQSSQEHGWNGENLLCEWDDNSIGYGGTLVYNKLIKNPNGSYRIVRANNRSKCSIDQFTNTFIGKTLQAIDRDRSKSVGQAMLGGSVSTHGHSYNEEVGFCTPDDKYIVSIWNYKHSDGESISDMSISEFEKAGNLIGIEVTLYEASRDEFVKRHGLGKSYNGWYNISNTFKGLRFKVNPDGIVAFSRERYQYKNTKITYHFEDGDTVDIRTKTKYYFPSADGDNVQHYTQMTEMLDEQGDNYHDISTSTEFFSGEFYQYNTVRKSDTDKMMLLKKQYGESNLNPTHFKKLDYPTIDVVSSDGTYITQVEQFPGKKEGRWDEKWNNSKIILVISAESASPMARMKIYFKNSEFEIAVRKKAKQLMEINDLWAEPSATASKKQEDREVERYVKILKDDTEPSNFVTVGNTEKLLRRTLEHTKVINQNNTEYQLRLDITIGDYALIEWQKDAMDDDHYTELIARITMKHNFKRIIWVHGGFKADKKNQLENHLKYGRINMDGIEEVTLINKNELYKANGYKEAVTVYSNNDK